MSLINCEKWPERQLGGGVCGKVLTEFINVYVYEGDINRKISDYHPDLGISCLSHHDGATKAIKHWRGIRFEEALYNRPLIQENTLYIRRSKSILRNVVIE